ncbi:PASTA domain-containing protein [Mesorhizobium sp.]|uniref:PASTA domain-containing protein n=1 Tax=Mesorhizobium sp. TaxID=1871066 RepID=UPI000FE6EDCD|nr:PASTA domain-containing protein [Mesorhizobium sp.]RWO22126.1 MAG: PASTA domain-containing protein [Mesorhizobium sp.]
MAIGQVTVPYRPGYAFGVGADLATGSPMGKVVSAPETAVPRAAGATINFQVHRIQSTEELEQALSIEAEASYGSGSFGANVSARFSYAKKAKIQSSSLFMVVTTRVELAFLSIDDPALSENAQTLVSRPEDFKARYGNVFVRGIGRGGLFVGTIRMETESAEESQEIAGELKGSYGLFSAEIKAKFAEIQSKHRTSTFIDMYHEGGPIDLHISDLTNPLELLDNANRFLDSFNTDPDKFAVPYFVTLAPIAIAKGPLPPNSAELEHAQDVLVACSKARSRLLDKINLLDYILDNTSRFEFTGGADRTAVQKALDDFQVDLDLVADCASTAIRSPAQAAMPATYAKNIGSAYPRAELPVLPVPKGGKMVAVPDFAGYKSWVECNEAATRAGLVAQQTLATIEPGDVFRVLSVSPPAGTSVPEGSVVTIVTQPTKVVVLPPHHFNVANLAEVLR